MRFTAAVPLLILYSAALAQSTTKLSTPPEPKSGVVPFKLSRNRVIVDVDLRLSDGTTQRVLAWVDNGSPDLYMSRRLAVGTFSCDGQQCPATPPLEMSIGGMTIPLAGRTPGAGVKDAWVWPTGKVPIAPGLEAEINVPSTILRNYDVLINFPGHELTLAQPGTVKFNGVKAKVLVNPENGRIQVPSQIENKKYNLALDLGSSISFLAQELFDRLASAHPDWPYMTGAIGPANMWGSDDEPNWKLMRIDRVQYGPLYLTSVPFTSFSAQAHPTDVFEKREAVPSPGLIGAEALMNYRVGLDYAHSTVYFDIGRMFNFPDFDVIGLILRPEDDGRFTILAVADFDGKPSVPKGHEGIQAGDHLVAVDGIPVLGSTMGQVWLMLGGEHGKKRTLTAERAGKQFTVVAAVQHFLGESDENQIPVKKH